MSDLTDRQLTVLRLTADGHTNLEIGEALFVSRRVVTNDLEQVRKFLGARTTIHAVAQAYRTGVLAGADVEQVRMLQLAADMGYRIALVPLEGA